MPLFLAFLLLLLMLPGCAKVSPTPAERYHADAQATLRWIRGPMMEMCVGLPGPESQRACELVFLGALGTLRGNHLTRQDQFRIELAKAKGTNETRRLWTQAQQETWLRGPRTDACRLAPLAAYAHQCLASVEEDLHALTRPDTIASELPVLRAERAVASMEAREHERTIERQLAPGVDLVLEEEAAHELMVLGIGGGLYGSSTAALPSVVESQLDVQMPLTSMTPSPPVSCTSQKVGQTVYTNCH